jgi:hypothetical protein
MMEIRYVAYGLELRSSFRLPGMVPAADPELPTLVLECATRDELMSVWSGAGGPPTWRGRLGDGKALEIELGTDGDVLFTYGDRACFRLDRDRRTLTAAAVRPGLAWQRALLTKVIPSISVMKGYEALHASALESPLGVVAIAAPSGTGKSTLAIELMRRGWPLFTDDVLTLAATPDGVRAHPGSPHMNLAALPTADEPTEIVDSVGVLDGERWVAAQSAPLEARPVHSVCLLARDRRLQLLAEPQAATPLPLSPYMLGLPGDGERERRRFELYASLMSSATLVRVSCGLGDRAAAVAEAIEDAVLGSPSAAAAAGVR